MNSLSPSPSNSATPTPSDGTPQSISTRLRSSSLATSISSSVTPPSVPANTPDASSVIGEFAGISIDDVEDLLIQQEELSFGEPTFVPHNTPASSVPTTYLNGSLLSPNGNSQEPLESIDERLEMLDRPRSVASTIGKALSAASQDVSDNGDAEYITVGLGSPRETDVFFSDSPSVPLSTLEPTYGVHPEHFRRVSTSDSLASQATLVPGGFEGTPTKATLVRVTANGKANGIAKGATDGTANGTANGPSNGPSNAVNKRLHRPGLSREHSDWAVDVEEDFARVLLRMANLAEDNRQVDPTLSAKEHMNRRMKKFFDASGMGDSFIPITDLNVAKDRWAQLERRRREGPKNSADVLSPTAQAVLVCVKEEVTQVLSNPNLDPKEMKDRVFETLDDIHADLEPR
ncbi:hypothetical protein M501DRAFT_991520 [Patellaria atrata CBS 101060]|uniref:Uncharacterized protein n=1 Tax=Patellaria atrata CBS 101060 TaxID=1346257 RepID=A0A9P4SBK2_9PEZI|nr:hypothetical protein M501DRAFT_991520 [Patellaria atrata CBS 101060]